jgi:hypothetical protein
MKILNFLKKKIRRIRKKIILKRAVKKMGGSLERERKRRERGKRIHELKDSIRRDLLYSWRIKELREPDKEDWNILNSDIKKIPMEFLISIKKKYWGGNIYNEL